MELDKIIKLLPNSLTIDDIHFYMKYQKEVISIRISIENKNFSSNIHVGICRKKNSILGSFNIDNTMFIFLCNNEKDFRKRKYYLLDLFAENPKIYRTNVKIKDVERYTENHSAKEKDLSSTRGLKSIESVLNYIHGDYVKDIKTHTYERREQNVILSYFAGETGELSGNYKLYWIPVEIIKNESSNIIDIYIKTALPMSKNPENKAVLLECPIII